MTPTRVGRILQDMTATHHQLTLSDAPVLRRSRQRTDWVIERALTLLETGECATHDEAVAQAEMEEMSR